MELFLRSKKQKGKAKLLLESEAVEGKKSGGASIYSTNSKNVGGALKVYHY